MRVEFLKARARCHRFGEEIRLIKEEQRRTFVSLEHAALKWDALVPAEHENPDTRDGLAAYAAEQADIRRSLVQTYRKIWGTPITEVAQYTMDDDGEDNEVIVPVPYKAEGEEGEGDDHGDSSESEDDLARFDDDSDED